MENYILILLTILIILVITIVYFGYKQLTHLQVNVNKNTSNIDALQSYLSNLNNHTNNIYSRDMPNVNNNHNVSLDTKDVLNNEVNNPSESDVPDEPNNSSNSDSDSSSGSNSDSSSGSDTDSSNSSKSGSSSDSSSGSSSDSDDDKNTPDVVEEVADAPVEEVADAPDTLSEIIIDGSNISKEISKINIDVADGATVDNTETDSVEVKLFEENNFMNNIDNILMDEMKVINIGEPSKKLTKLTPNAPAKNFETGHIEISENNNKKYEVVENKNGVKRWKKID